MSRTTSLGIGDLPEWNSAKLNFKGGCANDGLLIEAEVVPSARKIVIDQETPEDRSAPTERGIVHVLIPPDMQEPQVLYYDSDPVHCSGV